MDIADIHALFITTAGVCTDTRKLCEGEMYFALKGPNFNGNLFAGPALETGASYTVVDEYSGEKDERVIVVEDVLSTLQDLARFHRSQFDIPVIGITGSNGKTTNKELIQQVLCTKFDTHCTTGNLNNHIGVPLTLLGLTAKTQIAIIEMGANHVGEIYELCKIALPNYALITSIGVAHLEGFGSIEGIKQAKGELFEYAVKNDGKCFINQSLDHIPELYKGDEELAIRFGDDNHPPSFVSVTQHPQIDAAFESADGLINLKSQLIGSFQAANLLNALAIGLHFDVELKEIQTALENYKPANNRGELTEYNDNTIILDAYNANPPSMKAAIDAFLQTKGKPKMAILGDMFELGPTSVQYHQEIVDLIDQEAIAEIILIGKDFSRTNIPHRAHHFDTTSEAKEWWNDQNVSGYDILIKGSRGVHLEVLLDD